MGRRKKSNEVVENPVEMKEDALNLPVDEVAEESGVEEEIVKNEPVEETAPEIIPEPTLEILPSEPKKMRIHSNTNLVNVRDNPDGEVLFRLQNGSPILVEEEHGKWVKVCGWVMKDLVGVL